MLVQQVRATLTFPGTPDSHSDSCSNALFYIHRLNLVTGQEGNKGAEGILFLFAPFLRRNQFSVIMK